MNLQLLVNGILLGGLYAVAAAGFSLVWGVMNVINFAHAALIMIGGYVAFALWSFAGVDPFLAVPVAAVVCFGIGYAIQKFAINPIIRGPVFGTLISTFGVSLILVNIVVLIFGANIRATTNVFANDSFELGGLLIPKTRLVIFIIGVLIVVGLSLMLTHTRFGTSIRAVRMDIDAAQACGVNPGRVYALTFAIAAALAGVAGALLGAVEGISPVMGDPYLSKAFVVTILGGMGSIYGTLVAGIALGLIEAIIGGTIGVGYVDMIALAILLVVLVVRPSGLFGRRFY